jgi:hypothetical protein
MIENMEVVGTWERGRQESWLKDQWRKRNGDINWFLQVIASVTGEATSNQDLRVQDRRSWVNLALVALECAHDLGAISREELAVRRNNMGLVLARFGSPREFSPTLAPERLATDSLDCIGLGYQQVAELAAGWRNLDVETIRRLRSIKNIVSPLAGLVGKIDDVDIRNDVARWVALLPILP